MNLSKYFYLVCCLLSFLTPVSMVFAQDGTTKIILLRHSEKDTTGSDPTLSEAGRQRAARLPEVFRKFEPDLFYSTRTRRTIQTVQGWAAKKGREIRFYDPRQLRAFADTLRQQHGKTIVVVGHSNTMPMLVNELTGTSGLGALDESVYGKAWIVSIKEDKVKAEEVNY